MTFASAPPPIARPSLSYGWAAICLAGNAALELLDLLRADRVARAAWPFVAGSGPNIAGVLAVAGAFVLIALMAPPTRIAAWPKPRRINLGIDVAAAGLLLWEVLQPLTAHGVFDWFDLLATLATAAVLRLTWPRLRWLDGS